MNCITMIETFIDGYFSKEQCEAIKAKMQGKTFFNFDISYSNEAGNCTLIVRSNNTNYTPEELKDMFIYACISELADGAN